LLQAVISYLQLDYGMPRLEMLLGSVLCLLLVPVWRTIYGRIALELQGPEKLLFLGMNPVQEELAGHLSEHPELAWDTARVIDEPAARNWIHDAQSPVERIIVASAGQDSSRMTRTVLQVQQAGYRTDSLAATYAAVLGRISLAELDPGALFVQG